MTCSPPGRPTSPRQHPARTPGRRAAAALYVALATTKTPDSARRALGTIRDADTRAAAAELLGQLERKEGR